MSPVASTYHKGRVERTLKRGLRGRGGGVQLNSVSSRGPLSGNEMFVPVPAGKHFFNSFSPPPVPMIFLENERDYPYRCFFCPYILKGGLGISTRVSLPCLSEELEKAGTVDFKKTHLARKVGTRSRQCRPKVPGRFAFSSARNPRTCSISQFRKTFQQFSWAFPGVLLGNPELGTEPRNSHSLLEFCEPVQWPPPSEGKHVLFSENMDHEQMAHVLDEFPEVGHPFL